MLNEYILNSIEKIKATTNIDINIFDENKKKVYSAIETDWVLPDNDFDTIVSDIAQNATFFKFSFENKKFIGAIKGATEAEKNYAGLLTALLENSMIKALDLQNETECLISILNGEWSKMQIENFIQVSGYDLKNAYVIVLNANEKDIEEICLFLNQYDQNPQCRVVILNSNTVVYIHPLSKNEEYLSISDYVDNMYNCINNELSVSVIFGYGNVARDLTKISESHFEALNAIRIGKIINPNSHIYSYKEYIMIKIMEDLSTEAKQKYIDLLLDINALDILKDDDMMTTAEQFLENNLNISETSRVLFMHRNTLMYRLDKIEKAMGLNIKNFRDALTFRIITILYKLLNN